MVEYLGKKNHFLCSIYIIIVIYFTILFILFWINLLRIFCLENLITLLLLFRYCNFLLFWKMQTKRLNVSSLLSDLYQLLILIFTWDKWLLIIAQQFSKNCKMLRNITSASVNMDLSCSHKYLIILIWNVPKLINVYRCQVSFYTVSGKAQKLLLLIIARSMKPCHISIGGIFIASHEIFAKVNKN